MHILVAPNSYKNSLSAIRAADAIGRGLDASTFRGSWTGRPVGDGGDGTAELLRAHFGALSRRVQVHDPLGRPMEATFGLVESRRLAVIELADASGLRLLDSRDQDPLQANTRGTGELIRAALDHGARELILGIGGSATLDGGAGLLHALGARFVDVTGNSLPLHPAAWPEECRLDARGLDPRLRESRLTVLCDVVNPLLGPHGAAAVFGPQKGAGDADLAVLDAALARMSRAVFAGTAKDMTAVQRGGAAGGVAAGLSAVLDATLVDGIDYFLQAVGFAAELERADVVITGEGCIDAQTSDGKAPWGVAIRAKARGAFVVGMAGAVPLEPGPVLRSGFDVLIAIGHRPMTLPEALAATAENLERAARDLGNTLARAAGG